MGHSSLSQIKSVFISYDSNSLHQQGPRGIFLGEGANTIGGVGGGWQPYAKFFIFLVTKGAFLWENPNPDSCIQKRILRFFT